MFLIVCIGYVNHQAVATMHEDERKITTRKRCNLLQRFFFSFLRHVIVSALKYLR